MKSQALSSADFSANLFWDIDPATLDVEQHMKYVVARVLEAGTVDDWLLLCRRFTLPDVIEVAQGIRSLDPKSLAFLSVVGNVPREQFRCYTTKPSAPTHWSY